MGKIELNGMKFYGYHGCCDTEKLAGGRYIVNFSGEYDSSACEETDNLEDAINYAGIYAVIKERMLKPCNLLEHLCASIAREIKKNFPEMKNITVKVTKLNPPLPGVVDSSSFTCSL